MTPRAFPRDTSLRNIMKPAHNGYKPEPEKPAYSPPDVFNPFMETPDGEFDYLAVVENGVEYSSLFAFDNSPIPLFAEKTGTKLIEVGKPEVKPGLGWGLAAPANPDGCDGTYDGFCNRGESNACLLYAHNDNRGVRWNVVNLTMNLQQITLNSISAAAFRAYRLPRTQVGAFSLYPMSSMV
jgi:hypothetical protein